MTPEREKYLRDDANWGGLPATKRLEVFAALDEARAEVKQLQDKIAGYEHGEHVKRVGFCAITDCKLCPSPYSDPPEPTRTNCSVHKGFKEDCGCA